MTAYPSFERHAALALRFIRSRAAPGEPGAFQYPSALGAFWDPRVERIPEPGPIAVPYRPALRLAVDALAVGFAERPRRKRAGDPPPLGLVVEYYVAWTILWSRGNLTRAAKQLGLSRASLYPYLNRWRRRVVRDQARAA